MTKRAWTWIAACALACLVLAASQGCNALLGNKDAPFVDAASDAAPPGDALGGPQPVCPTPGTTTMDDPLNCRVCGHECLGGACVGGVCQPLNLFSLMSGDRPAHLASDGTTLFFNVNYGSVSYNLEYAPAVGGPPKVLTNGFGSVAGLAVDPTAVYWTALGSVLACPKPPSQCTVPATLATYPNAAGIALDPANVYWAVNEADAGIFSCSKASACDGGPTRVAPSDFAMLVAAPMGHVVWTTPQGLFEDFSAGPVTTGTLLGLAASQSQAYWLAVPSGSAVPALFGCGLTPCVPLVGLQSDAGVNQVTADNAVAYAADMAGNIWSYQFQMASVLLASGRSPRIDAIAVDSAAIYWSEWDGMVSTIVKLAKP